MMLRDGSQFTEWAAWIPSLFCDFCSITNATISHLPHHICNQAILNWSLWVSLIFWTQIFNQFLVCTSIWRCSTLLHRNKSSVFLVIEVSNDPVHVRRGVATVGRYEQGDQVRGDIRAQWVHTSDFPTGFSLQALKDSSWKQHFLGPNQSRHVDCCSNLERQDSLPQVFLLQEEMLGSACIGPQGLYKAHCNKKGDGFRKVCRKMLILSFKGGHIVKGQDFCVWSTQVETWECLKTEVWNTWASFLTSSDSLFYL